MASHCAQFLARVTEVTESLLYVQENSYPSHGDDRVPRHQMESSRSLEF